MSTSISGVGVLDKAMSIVAAVEAGPATLGELVERTGTTRATAHRLAVALEAHGLLRRDADGRFALGVRLVALGRAALSSFHLAELAEPILERLRDETGESVQLYVVDGDHRRCVMALDSPHELRTIVAPGVRLPLGRGSAGRLLAGDQPEPGGWLETVGEREAGVASVSAPVRGPHDELVAAISVSGPIDRISRSPGRRHGAAVATAAEQLSTRVGASR
ncbi:MAG TPA: IclR family transcriptional regulator [Microthrixaceae bacterium]|nr:IclR family transcriptional regulator [Microthrixaceae bacterium]